MEREVRRPSMDALPRQLVLLAQRVSRTLEGHGHRAWLVGGTVRDLALGRPSKDIDLTTAATPDEVQAAFPRTLALGKAFGTIVVILEEGQTEVTTFRADGSYSDGRRPDRVRFARTLEEDALRRDFRVNALYLDPLTDELADPTAGLEDLRAGRLRCVGDPRERFSEDGLRLLRLARFSAGLGLEVEPATVEAARASVERLAGVSPERILGELERIARGPEPARAARLLASIEAWPRILGDAPDEATLVALERLGPEVGLARLLATLLWPRARGSRAAALDPLTALRPPRALLRSVADTWECMQQLLALLALERPLRPSERVNLMRSAAWSDALSVFRASEPSAQSGPRWDEVLQTEARRSAPDFVPAPWLASADLAAEGVPPGPAFGRWLREAFDAQLDGAFDSRDGALDWLRARVAGTDPH